MLLKGELKKCVYTEPIQSRLTVKIDFTTSAKNPIHNYGEDKCPITQKQIME